MYINEKTFNIHPETTVTEKEMESYLFLENNGVDYIRAEHDEAATIELCEGVEKIINAKICKNLLLCNRQQTKFYMLLIPGDMPFKTKYLSSQINSSRLSFASGEQMEKLLNVSPGSLTVLSLMYDKEKTVEVFEDGYFKTGDLVKFDDNGYMYIVGRIKDIIVLSSGENVAPEELESKFRELECVRDCLIYKGTNDNGVEALIFEMTPRADILILSYHNVSLKSRNHCPGL